MELSTSLVKKFVEVTQETEESTGYYSYGTAIVDGDNKYVQLDGSDSVTSISVATDVATGDRVLIYIEDHTASVIGNITCPASGRTAIDVDERLLDFETLIVGDFQAINAEVEIIAANYVDTEYLTTNYVLTEYLVSNYITADTIAADYATIGNLTALWEYVGTLEASEITVEYLEANYANITDLTVLREQVNKLDADKADIEYLEATYATIDDLDALNATIYILDADYANIKNLLAGYAGVGDLQTIHLTADNVVFDSAIINDASIVSVSADKITAGTIYTSLVKIQTSENDTSLYLNDSLIQMWEDDLLRFQAGKDATGEYGLYIWNSEGKIMFDATGATSDGIGKEVIVNDMVADTANISGYKLDIDSVSQYLNEAGNIQVDATHVNINGQTLDYEIDSIIEEIEGLDFTNCKISKAIPYYGISNSETEPPVDEYDFTPALIDEALIDYSYIDVYEYDQLWTQEKPDLADGQYLWVKFLFIYEDETYGWSDPFLLSDGYLRQVTTSIQTELEVVSGQITAKVWESDIEQALTTTITDLWSEITVVIGDINLSVGDLTSTVNNLSSIVANVELSVGDIELSVEEIYEKSVTDIQIYFGISNSETEPPVDEDDFYPALIDEAVIDYSYIDVYEYDQLWTQDKPDLADGQYLWIKLKFIYADGSIDWSDPFLYTDEYLRKVTTLIENRVTSIELTVDSISLTASSSTNGTASIILSVGEEEKSVDVVTNAREAFENENSSISISAGIVTFTSGTIVIDSTNFSLTKDGNITSKSGTIGGWTITDDAIYNGTNGISSTVVGTYIGQSGFRNYKNSDTYVDIKDGVLTAYGGTFYGNISAESGKIGGLTIENDSLYNSKSAINEDKNGIYIGTDGVGLGKIGSDGKHSLFEVDTSGNAYSENLYLGSSLNMYSPNNEYISALKVISYSGTGQGQMIYGIEIPSPLIVDSSIDIHGALDVDYEVYAPYFMQSGTTTITYSGSGTYTKTISFTTLFAHTPQVILTPIVPWSVLGYTNTQAVVDSVNTNNFVIRFIVNGDYSSTITIQWVALAYTGV